MALLADILDQAARLEGADKANYLNHEIKTLKDVVFILEATLEAQPITKLNKDPKNLTATELNLFNSGKKIMAIKAVRTRTNCSLKEAKDAVEDYERNLNNTKPFVY